MNPLDYIDDDDEQVENESIDLIHLTIPASNRGERLDKVLAKLLPEYSRSRLQTWLEKGYVVNQHKAMKVKDSVLGGEELRISVPEDPQVEAFSPENIDLDIVYHDESIAVINKPVGMVVHPGAGNWGGTLLNGLLYHFPECSLVPRAGIVHRLDKDTSGLLVVAKNLTSQTHLVRQLQSRTVLRRYLALVWGKVPPEKIIHGSIGRDPKDRLKMAVISSGKPAVTHMKQMGFVKYGAATASLVTCKLETGRTHQIRVHMESIGHPLINDPVYKKGTPTDWGALRNSVGIEYSQAIGQALHAAVLGLEHPNSGKWMEWRVSPPLSFMRWLDELKFDFDLSNEINRL